MSSPPTPSHCYYATLNIATNATTRDIISAYREAKLVFHPDSLAASSIYSAGELNDILLHIEKAYAVLSNNDKRLAYDHENTITSAPNIAGKNAPNTLPVKPCTNKKPTNVPITLPQQLSGKKLKEIRKSLAISLDDITTQTKIAKAYFIAIETEDTSNFPAPIYMKSYLKQYAESLGLDAQKVLDAYQAYKQEDSQKP